jgi:hypothetical protein
METSDRLNFLRECIAYIDHSENRSFKEWLITFSTDEILTLSEYRRKRLQFFRECIAYIDHPESRSLEQWRGLFLADEMNALDGYRQLRQMDLSHFAAQHAARFLKKYLTEQRRRAGRAPKPPRRKPEIEKQVNALLLKHPRKSDGWIAMQLQLKGISISASTVRRIRKSFT